MKNLLRPAAKTCKKCAYYPNDCGYWELDGTRDKGGNLIKLNPELQHNCPNWHIIAK